MHNKFKIILLIGFSLPPGCEITGNLTYEDKFSKDQSAKAVLTFKYKPEVKRGPENNSSW